MTEYNYEGRDGTTITGLSFDPNTMNGSQKAELAKNLALARSKGIKSMGWGELDNIQSSPLPEKQSLGETAKNMVGGVIRGAGPTVTGAVLGAGLGTMIPGVGPVKGAKAGAGAYALTQTVIDPIVSSINNIFGTNYSMPGDAIEELFTRIGVPEPKTEAEKLVQTVSSMAANTGSQVALGEALQLGAGLAPTTRELVGKAMASGPLQQLLGGAGSVAGTEIAKEAGAGPVGQMAAGLGGGLVLGSLAGIKKPSLPTQADELMVKASKGSGGAQKSLAAVADINPESVASAERLGIDLPVDVFSDNPQIRSAAGLGRSVAGSKAESQWRDTVKAAVARADEIMQEAGATFSDGSAAPAVTSARVKDSLLASKKELRDQATKIFNQVDESVPKSTPATLNKTKQTLEEIAKEVGTDGMSPQEKKLLAMVTDPNTTYGRLLREKSLMGQAIARKDSPYGNMEAGALKRLYGSLAEDQLETVGAIGSPELMDDLINANELYGKEREIGKQIVNAFGKDQAGSISDKMRLAITSASKGDTGAYKRLLETVPVELRKDVVATSLASVARSGRGAESGGFGFAEYAKTYKGLRGNPEVYKSIAENLGPDTEKALRDLYEVSRKVTDARANVLQTGKANQAYLQGMVSENFLQKLLNNPLGKNVTMLAGTAAGASVAGPFGAAAGSGMASSFLESIAKSDKKTATMIGDLFLDPKFQGLMTKLSTGSVITKADVNGLANTQAFTKLAKKSGINIEDNAVWLIRVLEESLPKNEKEKK